MDSIWGKCQEKSRGKKRRMSVQELQHSHVHIPRTRLYKTYVLVLL